MALTAEIPSSIPNFHLRGDFPDECGYTTVFRQYLMPDAAGRMPSSLARIIPPNMANEDYRRIAEWADLPERIAYFQARTKEGRPAVVIVIVPGIAIPAPVTRLWNELPIPATVVSNDRWNGNLVSALPEQVLLHDRVMNTAYICPASEVQSLLLPSIRWRVP